MSNLVGFGWVDYNQPNMFGWIRGEYGILFQGLTLGLAYVAPIGMQNLFVIDSALTKPRRRALLTALIVLFFDVSLSLSCFSASAG